jgi:uncharacterized protein (TIGR03000 family)
MVPFKFAGGATAALAGGLLALAAPALAQPEPGSPSSPYNAAGPVAAGTLSGYTGQFATPVPPRGAIGRYRYSYSPTVYEAYSPVYEGPSPIILTSINYPGVYGSYMASVPAVTYNLRPSASNFYTAGETAVLGSKQVNISDTTAVAPTPRAGTETARINVLVPSEAVLTIQGQRMTQAGSYREFVSPPLVPGQDYTYAVRATWNENGRDVAREKTVHVSAGSRSEVDLMNAPREDTGPTLRTRPLP